VILLVGALVDCARLLLRFFTSFRMTGDGQERKNRNVGQTVKACHEQDDERCLLLKVV